MSLLLNIASYLPKALLKFILIIGLKISFG